MLRERRWHQIGVMHLVCNLLQKIIKIYFKTILTEAHITETKYVPINLIYTIHLVIVTMCNHQPRLLNNKSTNNVFVLEYILSSAALPENIVLATAFHVPQETALYDNKDRKCTCCLEGNESARRTEQNNVQHYTQFFGTY